MKFCPGMPARILTWQDPARRAGELCKTSGEVLGECNLSRGGELVAGQASVLVLDFSGLVVVRIVAEIGHRRRELLLELRVRGQAERIQVAEEVTLSPDISAAESTSAVGRIHIEPAKRCKIDH